MEKRPCPKGYPSIHLFLCCLFHGLLLCSRSMKSALNTHIGSQCLMHPSLLRGRGDLLKTCKRQSVKYPKVSTVSRHRTLGEHREGALLVECVRANRDRVHCVWVQARTHGLPACAHLWKLLGLTILRQEHRETTFQRKRAQLCLGQFLETTPSLLTQIIHYSSA
jgi:hypothetical protein